MGMLRALVPKHFKGQREMSFTLSAHPLGWMWMDARSSRPGRSLRKDCWFAVTSDCTSAAKSCWPQWAETECIWSQLAESGLVFSAFLQHRRVTQTGCLLENAFWLWFSMAGGGGYFQMWCEKQFRCGQLVPINHPHGSRDDWRGYGPTFWLMVYTLTMCSFSHSSGGQAGCCFR